MPTDLKDTTKGHRAEAGGGWGKDEERVVGAAYSVETERDGSSRPVRFGFANHG